MSCVAGTGHGINQSCFMLILPELEQRPMYNAYNFIVENYAPANSTVVGMSVSTFLCPETPLSTDTAAGSDPAVQRNLVPGRLVVRPNAITLRTGGVA